MKRVCSRPGCPHLSIEDGRECAEHTNETLRATRPAYVPEWLRRSRERADGLARDLTGAVAL